MITVIATLEAKEGKEEALEKALSQIIEPTRKEGGCINYDLHRTLDNPKVFVFYENWTGRAELDAHLSAPHMVDFIGKAKELLARPLDVSLLEMLSEPAS